MLQQATGMIPAKFIPGSPATYSNPPRERQLSLHWVDDATDIVVILVLVSPAFYALPHSSV